jgi:hypoxanthine phosphoribosyltransferase
MVMDISFALNKRNKLKSNVCNKEYLKNIGKYQELLDNTLFLDNTYSVTERLLCIQYNITTKPTCVVCSQNVYRNPARYQTGYVFHPYCSRQCSVSKLKSKETISGVFRDLSLISNTINKSIIKVDNPTSKLKWEECVYLSHGTYYDISLVPNMFKATEKLPVICPKHGKFFISADIFRNGCGCPKCKADKIGEFNRSTVQEFVDKANKLHNFKWNYDRVNYKNAHTKVIIGCSKHGDFTCTPDYHLRKEAAGCPKCISNLPIKSITALLDKHHINYIVEKRFVDCKYKKPLPFDIFLPDYNVLIEYDGPQHTIAGVYRSKEPEIDLEFQILKDSIKTEYCRLNNIPLIRIPHTEVNPDTFVFNILKTQYNLKFHYYSYENLNQDIRSMCNYINSFGYEKFAVYGVSRGGLIFAVPIAYHYDKIGEFGIVKFQRYDGNDTKVKIEISHDTKDIPIFIIDDLISSGKTMNKVVKAIKHKFPKTPKIHPIVIYGYPNNDSVQYIRDHPGKWINFFYETLPKAIV